MTSVGGSAYATGASASTYPVACAWAAHPAPSEARHPIKSPLPMFMIRMVVSPVVMEPAMLSTNPMSSAFASLAILSRGGVSVTPATAAAAKARRIPTMSTDTRWRARRGGGKAIDFLPRVRWRNCKPALCSERQRGSRRPSARSSFGDAAISGAARQGCAGGRSHWV